MSKKKNNSQSCCSNETKGKNSLKLGLFYGLLPHSFCLAFIAASVLGTTLLTGMLVKFLTIPYFFHLLVFLSLVLATISAYLYLRRTGNCCPSGVLGKWKYLLVLYGATLGINLLMFLVVLPKMANLNSLRNQKAISAQSRLIVLNVNIPCSGHAPLIIEELRKTNGVEKVYYNSKGDFEINFNPQVITSEQILNLEIFKTFRAVIVTSSV